MWAFLSNSRTTKLPFGIRGARRLGSACLGRLPTCSSILRMLAWASPLRRRHRLSRETGEGLQDAGEHRTACDQRNHVSFAKRMLLSRCACLDHELAQPWIPTSGDGFLATTPGKRAQTDDVSRTAWRIGLGTGMGAGHVFRWFGHQGSPVGICCAGYVLVGRRLAHGRHAEHLRCAAQTCTWRDILRRALAAKADLLTAGVAVDDHARVQFESNARRHLCETSPWS